MNNYEQHEADARYVAQLRSELGELKEKVWALEKERDELLWALQWSNSHASRVHYIGNSDEAHRMSDEQHANNQRVSALLDKYAATVWTATTAPTAGA